MLGRLHRDQLSPVGEAVGFLDESDDAVAERNRQRRRYGDDRAEHLDERARRSRADIARKAPDQAPAADEGTAFRVKQARADTMLQCTKRRRASGGQRRGDQPACDLEHHFSPWGVPRQKR